MRFPIHLGLGFAVAAMFVSGCKPAAAEDPSVATWHFAGSSQLPRLSDAPALKIATTTTVAQAAGAALAMRIAHTLWFTLTGDTNAPADALAVASPLIRELLAVESAGAVFDSTANLEFGFCARLDAARTTAWRDGMVKFFSAARGGDIGVWVGHTNGILTVAFPATAAAKATALSVRLGASAPNTVLEADLNFPKWTRSPWPGTLLPAPRAQVVAIATNQNVRTTATLTFPEALKLEIDPWQLPTSLMNNYTRSLIAVRGLRTLFEKSEWYRALGAGRAPNQAVIWMQPFDSLQTYFALPVAEPEKLLARIYTNASTILTGTNPHYMGSVFMSTNGQRLFLDEVPVKPPPMMLALRTNNADFLAGGVLPSRLSTNPVPAALLEQLNKPDLIGYSWEITEEGIKHWRTLAQLRGIIAHDQPVSPKAAGQAWLDDVIPKLGNTVTEMHLIAPNQVRIVRSAPAGLASFELVALTRWIDGPAILRRPPPKASASPPR